VLPENLAKAPRSVAAAVSLAAVLLLQACSEEAPEVKRPPPGVTVAPATTRTVKETVEFLGRTTAVNDVELRARVQGYLMDRRFREGDDVSEGDLLFIIDPQIYEDAVAAAQGDVAQANAEVARATDDLNRFEKLTTSQAVSEQAVAEAKTNKLRAVALLSSAQANLSRAQNDLEHTEIRAPISGRIGRSIASVGNLVDASTGALARLVELDPMYVTFAISDRELVDFKQRRKSAGEDVDRPSDVAVRLKLPNGTEFPEVGRFDFIDNAVDPDTGTVTIRARFPNPDKLLVPGLFVRAVVGREETVEKLMIPVQTVQEDQAGKFVMLVDVDGKVDIRRVKTGRQDEGYVVVLDGLQDGETVIVDGIQKVRPGMSVNVSNATVPQSPEG
jgi:membrane fusion protein (multidrug efflux system)